MLELIYSSSECLCKLETHWFVMATFKDQGNKHVAGCETPSCDILNDVQTLVYRATEDIERLLLRMASHNPNQLTCNFHKKDKCEKTNIKIKFDLLNNLMERLKQESLKHYDEHELTLTGQIRGDSNCIPLLIIRLYVTSLKIAIVLITRAKSFPGQRGRLDARQNVRETQGQRVAKEDSGISSITSQELERAMTSNSKVVNVAEQDKTFQTALKTVEKILTNADTQDADTQDAVTEAADTQDADTQAAVTEAADTQDAVTEAADTQDADTQDGTNEEIQEKE
ncbi:hypothetical protein Bpfe_028879 [Biomphalaria pfeifferi]|uniref:Uncharacterized protein n=1 Tax=Biomphalaria pfeifferi TaxID=112525 RepID=A0AAD8ASQ2_BIOPF|nr:hypothetical protein Bpfe_028879 [Biomphalaria pfeifferi]